MAHRDIAVLRELAKQWMDWAHRPEMAERRRAWTALKDLRAERPMVLFETGTLEDFLVDQPIVCEDPLYRSVEWAMRWDLRHAAELGDDIVIEPVWRTGWDVQGGGYGVDIRATHAQDGSGHSHGYHFNHPIRTPDDLGQLVKRAWSVDRDTSQKRFERLSEAFGDILPVVLHGTRSLHAGLTSDLFRLIGNENLLMWPFDQPDALHALMGYLRDDRLAWFDFMEREGLLGLNNDYCLVGSGSPGYVSALPAAGYAGQARLRDLWIWMESQETTMVSPDMFAEFFLPAMAAVAKAFGLVYYGCCEPVHDRWQHIHREIPHVRACSVSPWCDQPAFAEMIGQSVVFSRKPKPAPMTGPTAHWDELEADLDSTLAAAAGCNLEIVFRDVYRISGDRPRLARWVQMVRSRIGGR
ncbi:MAG: hypothetical protein HZB16_06495 [Armatimonadetes bacterium]|nr:hypothetical protein [Armatimonadota bacterium]